MLVNAAALTALFTGYRAAFNEGHTLAPSQWQEVAMEAPSMTAEEEYAWLKAVPGMREWIGDRQAHALALDGYKIRNRKWEQTIAVKKDHIDDDTYGVFTPLFRIMGESAGAHPNELVFHLLAGGFDTTGFDGQYFFDTDHPVLAADGTPTSVSNTGGGSGTAWYLLALNRATRPIIFQRRRPLAFKRKDDPNDDNVFDREEYVYGADARYNVGFGFWQLAYGSKQTLDATSYAAARAAMQGFKSDYGRPLGIMPSHLVVPPSLEGAARKIVVNDRDDMGATNEWAGTAMPMVVPWLA